MTNIDKIETPAMLYDLDHLAEDAGRVAKVCRDQNIQLLFPLKTCAVRGILTELLDVVDGFAASSFNEAMLAREVGSPDRPVHLTSPGLSQKDIPKVAELCDVVAANSLNQLKNLRAVASHVQLGLRVNPQISLVDDERFDPCRRHSKLGVPLDRLVQELRRDPSLLNGVSGLHFHSASETQTFAPLLRTVQHLLEQLGEFVTHLDWINLGGGYLFEDTDEFSALAKVRELIGPISNRVLMEPGTAITADCCSLRASVVDVFESQGKMVAILDTTVNHLPETLEFEYIPPIAEAAEEDGQYHYIVAGATCLAGDVFGEYSFDTPLVPGTTVTFENCGSYTLVKAHMFNGVNLPTLYTTRDDGTHVTKLREFGFSDYVSRFG